MTSPVAGATQLVPAIPTPLHLHGEFATCGPTEGRPRAGSRAEATALINAGVELGKHGRLEVTTHRPHRRIRNRVVTARRPQCRFFDCVQSVTTPQIMI